MEKIPAAFSIAAQFYARAFHGQPFPDDLLTQERVGPQDQFEPVGLKEYPLRIGLTNYDIHQLEPNAGEDLEAGGAHFDFAADLTLDLIQQKLLERVRVVEEWKGENTDCKEQDRQNTEHQCSETNGVTLLSLVTTI
jgi:hypothetical protein